MVLANVALAELHPIRQRELGLENVQLSDPVTGCVELADDMSADETGRTGDENGERFGIHAPGLGVNRPHPTSKPRAFCLRPDPIPSGFGCEPNSHHLRPTRRKICAQVFSVSSQPP
jgi:hypothetical protein